MTQRNWLCTLNNPGVDCEDYLRLWHEKAKATYVVGQLEKGEEGTPHVQFYLNFKQKARLAALKKHCSRAHFTPVKVDNGASTYCMKEETRLEGPWEFGVKPVKRNCKKDWEDIFEKAKAGDFEGIPADIKVKHYFSLKGIAKDHLVMKDADGVRGLWLWGEAGAGKSMRARAIAEDWNADQSQRHYPKMCNKWWDAYQKQDVVIMDDVGLEHKVLGHHLKIWSDRYAFVGESKGGAVAPNHKIFIVTSQYTIDQIWEDEETRAALKRRFKVQQVLRYCGPI